MDSLRSKKENLLSNEKLCSYNFDELTKYIQNKENVENIKNFLNLLMSALNLKLRLNTMNTRTFLTQYLFMYHSDIVLKSNDEVNEKMKSISYELSLCFDSLFNDYSLKNTLKFEELFNKYRQYFNDWKKRDSLIMIRPILKSYYELELIRDEFKKVNNKDFLHINRKLKSLEHNIKIIAGEEGLMYLKQKKIPVFKSEKMYGDVEKTVKKAFWDSIEENIENNKLEQIPLLLDDIKEMIKSMIKNKKYIENLDNQIDIEMVSNVLKSTNPDFKFIYNYISFLISKLFELQPPAEDQNTKLFKETIDNMFQKQEKVSKILRYFFENYFIKLEKIKQITTYINKNITKIEEI